MKVIVSRSAALVNRYRATEFKVGDYRCRYGQSLGPDDQPTGEWCVWLWNGHYWALLVRGCTDLQSAIYSASQELLTIS